MGADVIGRARYECVGCQIGNWCPGHDVVFWYRGNGTRTVEVREDDCVVLTLDAGLFNAIRTLDAPTEPKATPAKEDGLCSHCEGNGVVKIHHGVSVCPQCNGLCWAPTEPKS